VEISHAETKIFKKIYLDEILGPLRALKGTQRVYIGLKAVIEREIFLMQIHPACSSILLFHPACSSLLLFHPACSWIQF
jgi:hypothetical protein